MERYSLKSRDMTLTVEVGEHGLRFAELVSESGQALITDGLTVSMPDAYMTCVGKEAFCWKHVETKSSEDCLEIVFEDPRPLARQRYSVTVRTRPKDRGPFEIQGVLRNESRFGVRYWPEDWLSFDMTAAEIPTAMKIHKDSGVAQGHYWNGDHTNRYPGEGIYRTAMTEGTAFEVDTSTLQDFNSGGFIPMLYLDYGERYGAYLAIEWSSCTIRAVRVKEAVRVSCNLREGFSTRIPVGGEFVFPTVYLGAYDGDVDDGSNRFKRWFWKYKVPRILRETPGEPYTQMDMQLGFEVDGLGIESIKWDYSWWNMPETEQRGDPKDPNEVSLEGSWEFRQKWRLTLCGCKDLRDVADTLRAKGMNFTLYVLLHDTVPKIEGSLNSTDHPEWFSDRKITRGKSADLGNVECVAFIKEKLLALFSENHIPTWRSDFEPICYRSDKANRHDANGTDVQYWCTVGFCEIVDYLYENIPGFRYESCSSGGSMKDFLTMTRCVVINNDDSCNYNSLRASFYDASYCFCPAQLQAPTNPDTFCPESERFYQPPGDKDYGFRSTILSVPMLGSWSSDKFKKHLEFDLEEYYRKYLPLYCEKIRLMQRNGDLYHILPRPDNIHWDGVQYAYPDSPDALKGAAFLFKPSSEDGTVKTIRLRGLCPDKQYRLEFEDRKEQNTVIGGNALSFGIQVTIAEDVGSEIIWIYEAP